MGPTTSNAVTLAEAEAAIAAAPAAAVAASSTSAGAHGILGGPVVAPTDSVNAATDGRLWIPDTGDMMSRGKRKRRSKVERLRMRRAFAAEELRKRQAEAAVDERRAKPLTAGSAMSALHAALADAEVDAAAAGSTSSAAKRSKPRERAAVSGPGRAFAGGIRHHKARKKVAGTELTQLQAVLSHPAFRSNPAAAMQAHLRATTGADN